MARSTRTWNGWSARDSILDPTRWFIVILDMFGNGLSSSPSDQDDYPTLVTIHDNVQAQRAALHALFGIERVACVYGWSMGALQALPLGRAVSRCRRPYRRQLRRRPDGGAQPGLPPVPDGDAGSRAAAYRQRAVLGRTAIGQARLRTHLCRLGAEPGFFTEPDCIWRMVPGRISAHPT